MSVHLNHWVKGKSVVDPIGWVEHNCWPGARCYLFT